MKIKRFLIILLLLLLAAGLVILGRIKLDRYFEGRGIAEQLEGIDIQLYPNNTVDLSVHPVKAGVVYESDDPEIASVSGDGSITAVSNGTTQIRVTIDFRELFVPVEVYALPEFEEEMTADAGVPLPLMDSRTAGDALVSSEDDKIAYIDEQGYLQPVKAGETSVTVDIAGNVSVIKVYVSDLQIPGKLSLLTGQIYCFDTDYYKAIYFSTNPQVARVSNKGFLRTEEIGHAVIVSEINGHEYRTYVEVKNTAFPQEECTVRATKTIDMPLTEEWGSVRYSSEDKDIATIDARGTITGVSPGETLVYARCNGRSFSMKVTVTPNEFNVLFLGASTTYMFDIPGKFQKLAESDDYVIHVTSYTKGGATLDEVYDKFSKKIKAGEWDWVIMQEGSQYYSEYRKYYNDIKRIRDAIRKKNPECKFCLREMWYNKGTAAKRLKMLYANAEKIAEKLELDAVSFDGRAFRQCTAHTKIEVFKPDKHHQNNAGAYLAACCIYKALFDESPEDLKYLGGLTRYQAAKLQKIAGGIKP